MEGLSPKRTVVEAGSGLDIIDMLSRPELLEIFNAGEFNPERMAKITEKMCA